jgi:hypothetical protein
MALDRDAERAVIRDAIPRIYPEKLCTHRQVLEQLEISPRTSEEISACLNTHGYRSDTNVIRKEIANARRFIDAFHLGPHGFADRYKMHIPNLEVKKGSYRLTVVENIPPRNAGGFWAAHLANGKPTKIITGRPEFIHGKETGLLLRHEFLNGNSGEMIRILRESDPDTYGSEMKKVQPFIAVADVRAMLSIFSYLDSWRRDHNHLPPELLCTEEDGETSCSNLVTLGTPFDNYRVRDLEDKAMHEEWRGRSSLYTTSDGMGVRKAMPNGDYRVWVHRRSHESHCETLVNASISEALAPVCNFLTSDGEMNALTDDLWRNKRWTGYPIEFKIQFRVRMAADGVTARRVQVQQYIEMEDWFRNEDGEYCRSPKYEMSQGFLDGSGANPSRENEEGRRLKPGQPTMRIRQTTPEA